MMAYDPQAVSARLFEQARVDASNQVYRDGVADHLIFENVCAAWNLATEAVQEYGRPTLVEDGTLRHYENKQLHRVSTGLLELSGMTDLRDIVPDEVVPAIRITAPYGKTTPVSGVESYARKAGEVMRVESFMLRPQRPDDEDGVFRIRETQGRKTMRFMPGQLLHDVLSLSQDKLLATGHVIVHPEKPEPLRVSLLRPYVGFDTWYERTEEQVERDLNFVKTRTYADVSIMYTLLGAISGPLRNRKEFTPRASGK